MGGKKQNGIEFRLTELIVVAVTFIALIYWVFLPIWGALGVFVRALGGR